MKTIITIALVTAIAFSMQSCVSSQYVSAVPNEEQPSVSYQTFYDLLSPYGSWIDYPGYGYVWSPSIQNFTPYYDNGYWINTNMGWSWYSGYNWGWAPFHYGRWFYETGYGWLWLPGYEWAPAWVSWRDSDDYFGWAPLAPGVVFGTTAGFDMPFEHWIFVNHGFINDRNFRDHRLDEHRAEEVYNRSRFINNVNYTNNKMAFARGPEIKDVQRYTGHDVHQVTVVNHQEQHPAELNETRNEVKVFKPQVRMPQQQEIVRPNKVVPYKDIPHDNGRRGTWASPMQHPSQMNTGGARGGKTKN